MFFSKGITDSMDQLFLLKRWGVIALFLALTLPVWALDPHRAITQYRHDYWRVENGLPQNSVYAIAQTPDGYLWLGTSAGLVRFDGMRFTTFDNANTSAIKRNTISRLFADREGNLWIDTLSGGVLRYRNGQFHSVTEEQGLPEGAVTAWCEDRNGVFWIATLTYAGLMQWRDNKFIQTLPIERMPRSPILAMTFDPQGTLWLGTRDAGLLRFEGDRLTAFRTKAGNTLKQGPLEGLPDDKVNSLYADRSGDLWIGTDTGICKWSQGKITRDGVPASLQNGRISALNADRDGNLWVGVSGAGLYRLCDGRASAFTGKNGLTSNTVTSLLEGGEGALWVGTTVGLNRFRDGVFTTFTTAEGLPTDDAGSIAVDAKRGLWLAPSSGGLYRYQDGVYKTYRRDGLANDRVYSIANSRMGGLWLGRQTGGLTWLDPGDPGKSRTYTERDGLPQNNIFTVYEDRAGDVWAGTVAGALCRLRDGKFTTYSTRQGFSADVINFIGQDQTGNLLIGSNRGLIRQADGVFTTYTTKDGLAADDVKCFHEDSSRAIWIGTGAGLTRFRDGRFASVRAKDGLFDDAILGLIEGRDGNLWLSGGKGIFRVSLQELNDVADGRRRNLASVAYNTYDGLRGTEPVAGKPLSVRDGDGRLWFSTSKGVALLDPARIPHNYTPPSIDVESVMADGEPVTMENAFSLRPGVGTIELNYTAVNLLIPERVRYKYKLEGYDREWTYAGIRRMASYPQLAPGEYHFRVIACNNDGVWNEAGAAFSFRIRPFFYQTYPFYALCAAFIGIAAWGFHRLRLQQLQGRMRERFVLVLAERTRVAREIHDTLLQGFTGISLKLDAVAQKLPRESEAKQQLETVLEQADQALTEARRAVWDMRSPLVEAHGLAQALANSARHIIAGTPAQLEIAVDGAVRDLPPAVEDNLLRICQEAVTNSIRHGSAKQVTVVLSYERRQVRLRIEDNGCGFDPNSAPATKNGHFGLVGMQERAKKLGGELTLNSRVNSGTQVCALIPVE
jgi:signal transduction histidine kinase/ligand-binding sensor domain-containing protein